MADTLITGGAGFLGYHVAKILAAGGGRVDLLDNLARGKVDADLKKLLSQGRARIRRVDLLDSKVARRLGRSYSQIYHFAAIVGVSNVLRRPYDVLEQNTSMTLNALSVARNQRRLKRFVFASTSEVYSGTLARYGLTLPTPESTPLSLPDLEQPRTSYMLSKIYGEALCLHSGLPITIVRPHNVYGPRMGLAHVIPELLKRSHEARDGGQLEVFSPRHRRTFCFVDDAAELIVRLAARPAGLGRTLNIGAEKPEISIRRLAQLVIETVGRKLTIKARAQTPGSPARRCPDMRATARIASYRAQTGIEDGLKRTYEWYRGNVFNGGQETAI